MLAVARGDLCAFGQLVSRHQTSAWNAAFRFLGNAADAEDVAQDAFLRILGSAERYRPTAGFRTYFYRIITHLCFDLSRRQRLRRGGPLSDVTDRASSPAESAIERERADGIREALDLLPPTQKMAVVLRYYENLGYREIADALRTSVKAVERALARARATLEGRLGEYLDK